MTVRVWEAFYFGRGGFKRVRRDWAMMNNERRDTAAEKD
jgi:hypothetical protein